MAGSRLLTEKARWRNHTKLIGKLGCCQGRSTTAGSRLGGRDKGAGASNQGSKNGNLHGVVYCFSLKDEEFLLQIRVMTTMDERWILAVVDCGWHTWQLEVKDTAIENSTCRPSRVGYVRRPVLLELRHPIKFSQVTNMTYSMLSILKISVTNSSTMVPVVRPYRARTGHYSSIKCVVCLLMHPLGRHAARA